MESMKELSRPENLDPFKGFQLKQIVIAGDDVVGFAGQGTGKDREIIRITQQDRHLSRIRHHDPRCGQQSDKIPDICQSEVIAIFEMGTGQGVFQFGEQRHAGDEFKVSPRQACNIFAELPRGVMKPLMRTLVSRTALGTPTPAAGGRSTAREAHSQRRVPVGTTRGFGTVSGPDTIEDPE